MGEPDLRQLRYFAAVAKELHFGRAAQRLGMAQPPLTQQIQRLEKMLGCKLFERGRETTLTAAGTALLEEARLLLGQADRVFESARRAGRGETGEIVVGVPPSVMLSPLPKAIAKFRKTNPDVVLHLRERATSAIEEGVRSGELDLGYLRESNPPDSLVGELVFKEEIVAVFPSGHPAGTPTRFSLRSLRNEPFVFFPRRLGGGLYDRLLACCATARFTPRVEIEVAQWQTVLAFVEAGAGVSLAPASVANLRWAGVESRPLPGETTAVYTCHRPNPSPVVERFLSVMRPMLKSAFPKR